MRHKRVIIDLHFDGVSDSQANEVCDAIAQTACTEDILMPLVLECMDANKIKGDITWEVRRETFHPACP